MPNVKTAKKISFTAVQRFLKVISSSICLTLPVKELLKLPDIVIHSSFSCFKMMVIITYGGMRNNINSF